MGLVRVLLAVSVLITHSEPILGMRFLNGDAAITCFYMISGFLMALILSEKYTSTRAFYLNRALRIYPPYWVAMLMSFVVYYFFPNIHHDPIKTTLKAIENESFIFLAWGVVSNLTLIGVDLTRYIQLNTGDFSIRFPNFLFGGGGGGHNILAVPQAWTLAIELQFYLCAPFFVRQKTSTLLLLAVFFTIIRMLVFALLRWKGFPIDDAALFPMQLHYFLYGVIGYKFYRYYSDLKLEERTKARFSSIARAFAVLMVIFGLRYLDGRERWEYDFFYIVFACTVPFQFYAAKSNRLDAIIGEFSYPIYLFHFIVILGLAGVTLGVWRGEMVLLLTFLVSAIYIHTLDPLVQRRRGNVYAGQPIR